MYKTLYVSSKFGKLITPTGLTAISGGDEVPRRLFLYDNNSGQLFLVDTGADVSVIPVTRSNKGKKLDLKLYAANGSRISTFVVALLHG